MLLSRGRTKVLEKLDFLTNKTMKTETRTVYKVVTRSLLSPYAPTSWTVQYKVDEKVKPVLAGTYLFAFTDLDSAKNYADRCGLYIYEAEATGPFYGAWLDWRCAEDELLGFFRCLRKRNKTNKKPIWNSVCCSSITLKKRII